MQLTKMLKLREAVESRVKVRVKQMSRLLSREEPDGWLEMRLQSSRVTRMLKHPPGCLKELQLTAPEACRVKGGGWEPKESRKAHPLTKNSSEPDEPLQHQHPLKAVFEKKKENCPLLTQGVAGMLAVS